MFSFLFLDSSCDRSVAISHQQRLAKFHGVMRWCEGKDMARHGASELLNERERVFEGVSAIEGSDRVAEEASSGCGTAE